MCNWTNHQEVWTQLLHHKCDTDDAVSKDKFVSELDSFANVTDWPRTLLTQQLWMANPDLKIVLAVRDTPEAWFQSFKDTIWQYQSRKYCPRGFSAMLWYLAIAYNGFGRDTLEAQGPFASAFMQHTLRRFPQDGKQWYIDHNTLVQQLVPSDRLLVFNAKDGWEPLCQFLRRRTPNSQYPRSNGTKAFREALDANWAELRRRTLTGVGSRLLIVAVGILFVLGVLYSDI